MPITVNCECGKVLRVKDEAAGKKGRCPSCGAVFDIPAPSPSGRATPAPASSPRPSSRRSAAPSVAPAATPSKSPSSRIIVGAGPCPGCKAPLAKGAVLCVRCGYDTRSRRKLKTDVAATARSAKTRDSQRATTDSGQIDLRPYTDEDLHPYREYRWLVVSICVAGAVGACVAGVMTDFITIQKGFPEDAGAIRQSWELLKAGGCFFGGAFGGAFIGQFITRFLPK